MESYLIYFAKVNGLLILFYIMYVLFLRKETFFIANRWYLLSGLFVSVTLPLLTFTKTIWIEPTPIPEFQTGNIVFENLERIQFVPESSFDWSLMLLTIYGTISLLIILKIAIELASFFKKISNQNIQKLANYSLVDSTSTENPFSFFNYIVINKNRFSENELQHILMHESVHVAQKHSLDVLLSKVYCALLWVNPIIWLYHKAVLQNLEFIADKLSFEQIENKYDYQRTLLKVVTNQHQLSITNQFYQSLIKKRIVMLHTNQSQKKNVLKYAFILPVLVGFMLFFQVETVAQVKGNSQKNAAVEAVPIGFSWNKNASDAEMKLDTEELKKQGIDYKFSKIKRNKKGEIIAIKIEFNDNKGNKGVKEIKGNEPIEPIYFSTESNSIGFTEAQDLSDYIVDEKLSKQFGTEIKVKKVSVNGVEIKTVGINWDGAVKISESQTLPNHPNKNQLYIINGKEYTSKELKGKKVETKSSVIHYYSEEAIKKFGKKGKNGVLLFEGKSEISDGDENQIFYKGSDFKNIEPKNIKLNFEKGKQFIIGNKKYRYEELKDKNWFLYTGTPHKIEEKNNIVTITGDVVENAKEFNSQEVIYVIEPEKIENKKFVLKNGNWLVIFENEMIKVPKYPTYSLKNVKIQIDGIEVLSKFEVLKKYDSNSFKEVKVIEDHLSTDESLIIKNIIIKTK